MKTLFILNDPPYGSERCYNALRLAHAPLKKDPQAVVTVFLMADAVIAAKAAQKTPDGYYNLELTCSPSFTRRLIESVPLLLSRSVVQRDGARSPRSSAASRPVALRVVCA